MIVAAHHANYLPAIDVFAKMMVADRFVIADDVQYSKHALINRCRIKNAEGWQWLTVPVYTKGRLGQLISEVEINNSAAWARRHWRSLVVNYRHAAFFELWAGELETIYRRTWRRLIDLNLALIEFARRALRITTPVVLSSQLDVAGTGSERLAGLTRAAGGTVYLCGADAAGYVQKAPFERAGIELRFLNFEPPVYHQLFGVFVPNLSVVDLLFNEGAQSHEFIDAACGRRRS